MSDTGVLMDFEDRMLILTPQQVREKIEEHERALRLWRGLLPLVEELSGDEKERSIAPSDSVVAGQNWGHEVGSWTRAPTIRERLRSALMPDKSMTVKSLAELIGAKENSVYQILTGRTKDQRDFHRNEDGTYRLNGQASGRAETI